MKVVLGAGHLDREIDGAEALLRRYRADDGMRYLEYKPVSPSDALVPDDLAVTVLMNSRFGAAAFKSVQDRGADIALSNLPSIALEVTTHAQRVTVCDFVAEIASWKGFAASVATKLLHKKRPALVPILDNQAVFGAYMNPGWPASPSRKESVYSRRLIMEAIEWIYVDITRPDNNEGWKSLGAIDSDRSRIELFDMVWWMYFRQLEPAP